MKGTYSTLQLPSLLSLQEILDSDGPSTVMDRSPIPAPLEEEGGHTQIRTGEELQDQTRPSDWEDSRAHLVMILKLLGLSVRPCWRPGPEATTLLGSHPSDTETLKGLLGTGVSSYRTWTL